MLDHPLSSFPLAVLVLWLSARVGIALRARIPLRDEEREDFGVVLAASLTLLSLIIGFSFSMAIARYDQRRTLEEAEANAIGTEFVRTGLLPSPDSAQAQSLLRQYLDVRISFYLTRDKHKLQQIDAETNRLQTALWSAVQSPAMAHPDPVVALAVSGINDVLNSQGYTQAAWWNRIPTAAWLLMVAMAVGCNVLVGYGRRSFQAKRSLVFILPCLISTAFVFIADIDSPRDGMIRVPPQNLISLSQSLR